MNLDLLIKARGQSACDLCASPSSLSVYEVPHAIQEADRHALLCSTCVEQIQEEKPLDEHHWRCLGTSMWSEHDSVKVLAYRLLHKLRVQAWAEDLLSQLYLEEGVETWAKAGLSQRSEEVQQSVTVLDSNGNVLQEGDTVTLIKDLDVKGANFTAKRGTVVKNINLTDDPKYIEGRVNGTRIVLVAAYLKKA